MRDTTVVSEALSKGAETVLLVEEDEVAGSSRSRRSAVIAIMSWKRGLPWKHCWWRSSMRGPLISP